MTNLDFESVSLNLKHMLKGIQYMKSQKLAEYDLKGSTTQCLCCIAACENGLNAGELSTRLNIDKAQVSRCVAELIERGFIFRNEQEGKQYRQKYCLTESGRLVASDISKTSRVIHEKISAGVQEKDVDAFCRVLETLCRNSNAFFADVEK